MKIPSTIRLNIRAIIKCKDVIVVLFLGRAARDWTGDLPYRVHIAIWSSWILSLSHSEHGKTRHKSKANKKHGNTFYTSISKIYFFTASIWLLHNSNYSFHRGIPRWFEALCISLVIHQTFHICLEAMTPSDSSLKCHLISEWSPPPIVSAVEWIDFSPDLCVFF